MPLKKKKVKKSALSGLHRANADTETGPQQPGDAQHRQAGPLSAAWTAASLPSPPLRSLLLPLRSLRGSPSESDSYREFQVTPGITKLWALSRPGESRCLASACVGRRATGPAAGPLSTAVHAVSARDGNLSSTFLLRPPDQWPLQSEGGQRTNGGPSSALSWYLEKISRSSLLPFHNINQI